jgi:hypothetical protein
MQIRLSTLLLAMPLVGTSLALAGGWGIVLAGYSFLLVYFVRGAVARKPSGFSNLAAFFLVSLTMSCMVSETLSTASRGPSPGSRCVNNLHELALALVSYRKAHGSFPPPYLTDSNGKPMHSWRVLVLPDLERADLGRAYRLDEPWDGPNNRQLSIPLSVFRCPSSEKDPKSTETNYVMVTGPGTAAEALAKGSPKPGASVNRIVLVEVADSGIDWMEPKDLTLEEALAGINCPNVRGISARHGRGRGANVAFSTGTVRRLPATLPRESLEAFLTQDLTDAEIDRLIEAAPPDPAPAVLSPAQTLTLRIIAWFVSLGILLAHGVVVDVRDRRRKKASESADNRVEAGSPGEPPA